ncbi:Glu/Leu/Phe/Val dehydrogenase dimerization domain-containing protein [Nocardioides sp. cx-173]|uniref:Glu/Leu/Phe/Val dehydrogenase dimerization domain-containing protein n=1 Tax=Nocardioides sp. cx-173 TaxID=2898796 RepID=UPI001E637300|nr:Glu/Leu/Phe/Val dehydrogenase dimerization domain-containing protein [Nocardioides sp. cx-173]MCD4523790.1 valine dehydrogenase [Nocardioides sp. cx-173]UGB41887.1 valine dehydrogenase [Nocardioides sp. cx-173]
MDRTRPLIDPELLDPEHEEVRLTRGTRTGLPLAIAIHSTGPGPAIGGCRIRAYPSWQEGLADVLRLSRAMTQKCALAGLPHGGGKAVAMVPDRALAPSTRRALILDIADCIAQLDGRYLTGPDLGSGPDDMALIHDHAHGWAFCRPESHGGSGDSSPGTARGVVAALTAALAHTHGRGLAGLRVGVVGFGRVGRLVASTLAAAGARVIVSDVDDGLRPEAERRGRAWASTELVHEELDVLVPAATGGLLTAATARSCRATLVVGPANNQLADEGVEVVLRERGIVWVPDVIASAGGIIHAVCREELDLDEAATNARIDAIGDQVSRILEVARDQGTTTSQAARAVAAETEQPVSR